MSEWIYNPNDYKTKEETITEEEGDIRYVNASGDNMSGILSVPSLSVYTNSGIIFQDSTIQSTAFSQSSIDDSISTLLSSSNNFSGLNNSFRNIQSNQIIIYDVANTVNAPLSIGLQNKNGYIDVPNTSSQLQIRVRDGTNNIQTTTFSNGIITNPKTIIAQGVDILNSLTSLQNQITTLSTTTSSKTSTDIIQIIDDFNGNFPTINGSSVFDGVLTWTNQGNTAIGGTTTVKNHPGLLFGQTTTVLSQARIQLIPTPMICTFNEFVSVEWIFRYNSLSTNVDIAFGVGSNLDLSTAVYAWQYTGLLYKPVVNGKTLPPEPAIVSGYVGNFTGNWVRVKIEAVGEGLIFTLNNLDTGENMSQIVPKKYEITVNGTIGKTEIIDGSNVSSLCSPIFRLRNSTNGSVINNSVNIHIDYMSFCYRCLSRGS